MTGFPLVLVVGLLSLLGGGLLLYLRWGMNWGATPAERASRMPGDSLLDGAFARRVTMTRAISLRAPTEKVWPWLAQLGRGAGWYSVDWLDNGRRTSARHVVSWIPKPQVGDASAIGYLRHIEPGRSMVWWANGVRFAGARARLVVDLAVSAEGSGSRVVIRMSADAQGALAPVALLVFRCVDTIMAHAQLLGLRARVESSGADMRDARQAETGSGDQYQLYQTIYAGGGSAGVRGKEQALKWRSEAIRDGLVLESGSGPDQRPIF